jgi:hypothetical protein
MESKTLSGRSVYNRILFYEKDEKDIWLMQQSHHGLDKKWNQWDRLAIVVDKSTSPKRAQFFQLPPGKMKTEMGALRSLEIQPRIDCLRCHSNGPRLIRPKQLKTSGAWENVLHTARLLWWNLKILTYGRVNVSLSPRQVRNHWLRPEIAHGADQLEVKTCSKCHRNQGLFARGPLTRYQVETIRFLIESKSMPPWGHTLSEQEKVQLKDFINGF